MKYAQYSPWIAAALAVLAGSSLAGVDEQGHARQPGNVPGVDAASVPAECRPYLSVPADSTSESLAWEQRLSLAACRQTGTVAPVTNPERLRELVDGLVRAAEPSIAIYRDALERGPARIRIMAAYGLAMTHVNIIVRARSALRVTAETSAMYGGATYGVAYVDRYQALSRALEPLLAAERAAAYEAFQEVIRIAEAEPAAARADQVVVGVVAEARTLAPLLR